MRRLTVSLLAVPAVAVGLTACGGDDAMSAEEYRAEAKEICQSAEQRTEAVEQPTRPTNKAIVAYLNDLLEVNERTTQQFSDLEPPEELSDEHQKVLESNRESVAEVNRLVDQLEGGTDAKEVFQENQERLAQVTQEANSAIESLGVPECTQ